jgi:hypothetical protein
MVQFTQTHSHGILEGDGGLVLYPNPASGSFSIRACDNASLYLYDASGKELMHIDNYQAESVLDISKFPVGIYPLRIVRGNDIQWLKLIKR